MEEEQTQQLEASISDYPGNWPIPIDLFVSKKHRGVTHGDIGFADSSGNIVYRITRQSPKSSPNYKKLLFDAAGNPLLSIYRTDKGRWECYKVENNGDKDLVLRVKRTVKKLSKVELEVFLVADKSEDSSCDFKVTGSPFMKSCTIYENSSLVAQTSLMYKLHDIYVRRGKFRLTIFPGFIDNVLIVALVVIFLNGRK